MSTIRLLSELSGTMTIRDMAQGLEILCQYAVLRENREVACAIQTCLCDILMMELKAGQLEEGVNPHEESLHLFSFVLEELMPMI